ncbi:hypothetical protein [Spirosoma foliorum]|uniref:Uncharacterized protein n=1 Tax=Spirosoma foliorum TaxID=2710596 RepID=A0A7G5H5N1_9BACT|nr:hypothetical protein [Spirosoma foliorum]QMW06423.1 hypothetical protein H3H32_16780 [Spirosoma foliorum]
MSHPPKLTAQERQRAAHQLAEASKKPYIAKGTTRTILFLTEEQAAKRSDLIPQFGRLPLGS